MNIDDFLAAHPMPWKHEQPGSGFCASVIRDSGAIAKDILRALRKLGYVVEKRRDGSARNWLYRLIDATQKGATA